MKSLKILFLIVLINSCTQSFNSSSFDRLLSKSVNINRSSPQGERLFQAYSVINSNCISCHTGYHNSWKLFDTDQKWLDSTMIEKNDPYASTLIIRLKNTGGNMPRDNAQLSQDDFDTILTWINSI